MPCSAGKARRFRLPTRAPCAGDLLVTLRKVNAFLGTPLGENLVRMALRQDGFSYSDHSRYWTDRFTRHQQCSIELRSVASCAPG